MQETRLDLIKKAEEKAMESIDRLSNLDSMVTKGQIRERIRQINRDVRNVDLVIESRTFMELANITGIRIPQLNDRILLAIRFLYEGVDKDDENSFELLKKVMELIFEWDSNILEKQNKALIDLQKYSKISTNEDLEDFTRKIIGKYKFRKGLYDHYIENYKIENNIQQIEYNQQFYLTIPFLDEIGPLISIYDSIHNTDEGTDEAKLDATLGILQLVLGYLDLSCFHTVDFIPTLLRAIVRKNGLSEEAALKMEPKDITRIASQNEIGIILMKLSKAIFKQKQDRIEKSRIGRRLFLELKNNNFWESISFRPKLGMLEEIAQGLPT